MLFCSLYDSDVSQDWYSPSYSPPDHAYTPTGDVDVVVDDYDVDYDYVNDDDDWRYDDRRRGTGRKLPAPPPTADYSWQPPLPPASAVNGEYVAPPGEYKNNTQQTRPADSVPQMNGVYTGHDDQYRDYSDYNGYCDDYYDGSDGYDRTSYDDRYYMSFDGEYGDGLVNGYVDAGEMDRYQQQQPYYDYNDAVYQQPSQHYDGPERDTDVDQLPAMSSPAVHAGDVIVQHDAIYDDGYIDRNGVYRRYSDRRYDDERYYNGGGGKYVGSIPSDAGESAYDELTEEMMSVPARSSIDSSATPAAVRYYDGKTDSFESYDRESTAPYDAATTMKDTGYQTFNQQQLQQQQQQPVPPLALELPYFNHADVNSWQPPPVNGDMPRSPVTIIDAQTSRQSFVISHPADNAFADQRWPASSPLVDGLPVAPAPAAAGFCDTMMIPTSSVDSTNTGWVRTSHCHYLRFFYRSIRDFCWFSSCT